MEFRDSLVSTMKHDRRWKSQPSKHSPSNRSSLIMGFFSCLACLYVAGRLWQDAQNRILLSTLLQKNLDQRPKILTVEDKLMTLGCKDLGKRIVEVETELTLAKSQGYLRNQFPQNGSLSTTKLLAVIGVYTGFGSRLKRNTFRGSWMPRGDALKKLEERGVVIRFVIGRSANRGDSLDHNIDDENRLTQDFLILEAHEEAQEEVPKKAKYFFATAVESWDAEFYVKIDDSIDLDLDGLVGILESHRGKKGAYIGCMKSGEIISEEGKPWYEPQWWKFGDEKSYFRHAAGSLLIISKNLARYINTNRQLGLCWLLMDVEVLSLGCCLLLFMQFIKRGGEKENVPFCIVQPIKMFGGCVSLCHDCHIAVLLDRRRHYLQNIFLLNIILISFLCRS